MDTVQGGARADTQTFLPYPSLSLEGNKYIVQVGSAAEINKNVDEYIRQDALVYFYYAFWCVIIQRSTTMVIIIIFVIKLKRQQEIILVQYRDVTNNGPHEPITFQCCSRLSQSESCCLHRFSHQQLPSAV